MSGLIQIDISEARGFVAIPADIDRLAIVMGCASGLPAVAAGLKAATATVASIVTLTAADLLAAGVAALAANPRRLTFATAGATPSDAPANVVIVGLVWTPGAAPVLGGETLVLAQTAGEVVTVNRYSSITSLTYPVADGTGATIAIGYQEGEGLSPFYLSGASAVAGVGYGDAPDALTQIIEQRLDGEAGTKYPAALYTTATDTPGAYGTINILDVLGTARPANADTDPYGTYHAAVEVVDDGNDGAGGVVGTTGMTYRWALDYDNGAPTWSRTTALGTAYTITIPNSGVAFELGAPAAQVTAFIAAAVEARADTLAHLADAVAHDAADTSAEQVALAASSAPTTEAQAWAVMNLCRAALESHRLNITAHNGSDIINTISHAAATSGQTGIDLYIEYRADFNAHLAATFALSAAGLKAATATVAAPVTLTSADLLDAGEAVIATNPRRPTFTTAGVTPSDAPATATIVGVLGNGETGGETLNLAQTAATVAAVNDYRSFTSIDYPAADGTGATIAIGYGQGVHNSADATNTLTSTTPTHGTLKTGDLWRVRTLAPKPGAAEIADAFAALVDSSAEHALLVLEFPLTQALVATVTTGLNDLAELGRDVTCIARTRLPDFETNETEAAWFASLQSDFLNEEDSRVHLRSTYQFITDAMTSRKYLRSDLAQYAADIVRVPRAQWPDCPYDRAMPNATLIDVAGVTRGHDEGPQGALTGLSNDTLGNRFGCVQRLAISTDRQSVYATVPWVLYADDERVRTLMVRRLMNAMKRTVRIALKPQLGGPSFYRSTGPTTGTLIPSARKALHGLAFRALQSEFGQEILNANDASLDTGLVQIDPAVTVAPGRLLGVEVTLAFIPPGYTQKITVTMSVEE